MWVGKRLTCKSGRFCTQGTANLPFLEGSQPYLSISRGNADHNWCRRAGPAGPLGYHTVCNVRHLQLGNKTANLAQLMKENSNFR